MKLLQLLRALTIKLVSSVCHFLRTDHTDETAALSSETSAIRNVFGFRDLDPEIYLWDLNYEILFSAN